MQEPRILFQVIISSLFMNKFISNLNNSICLPVEIIQRIWFKILIFFSPDLPENEATFAISNGGICDAKD